jgi:acylphosphatase
MPERRTILYSGTVQGVGFRWMTQRALEDLAVAGYVRNLRDGRVELVLEGESAQIDEAVDRVRGSLGRYIFGEEATDSPATGGLQGFSIRP